MGHSSTGSMECCFSSKLRVPVLLQGGPSSRNQISGRHKQFSSRTSPYYKQLLHIGPASQPSPHQDNAITVFYWCGVLSVGWEDVLGLHHALVCTPANALFEWALVAVCKPTIRNYDLKSAGWGVVTLRGNWPMDLMCSQYASSGGTILVLLSGGSSQDVNIHASSTSTLFC